MIRDFFYLIAVFFVLSIPKGHAQLKQLQNKAHKLNLASSEGWLKLLHYRKRWLGGYKSEADSPNFFLHPDGRYDPQKELEATLIALWGDQGRNQEEEKIAACRFPARKLFLQKALKISASQLKEKSCPKYEIFKKQLSAKSVSLVFSSYYLNTPASAFGHTLLRIGKSKHSDKDQKFELLDYGINYAANVTTNNALLYALLGLTGGFQGEFAAMPYFYKVREYNDFESRDLWSYELDFTQEQIDLMVAHIWEMSNTYFDYYYLTKNCSYFIMAILDAANPKLNLVEATPYIVIPVDTLKVVAAEEGLVKNITYRPSQRSRFKARLKSLNPEQKTSFEKLTKNLDPLSFNISDKKEKAFLLDSGLDYLDYKYAQDLLLEKSQAKKIKNKFLIARAQIGVQTQEQKVSLPIEESPHLGHGSTRVGLFAGYGKQVHEFSSIEYRGALHDLLDPSLGQNPNMNLEMVKLKIRANFEDGYKKATRTSFWLEDLSLVNVYSLSPLEKYFNHFSWMAKFGAKTLRDRGCLNCLAAQVQIGAGLSQKFSKLNYYLFLSPKLDISKKLTRSWMRFGLGPMLAIQYAFSKQFKWQVRGEYHYQFFMDQKHSFEYGSEMRLGLGQSWAINLKMTRYQREAEGELGVYFYY